MTPRTKGLVNCPNCLTENVSTEDHCRSCGKALTLYIGPAANLPRRFGVGSLMLLVFATAPGLAALRPSPGLGVMLLLILTPAAVRTTAVLAQRAEDHRPLSLADKVAVFLGSSGLMIVIGFLTSLTFVLLSIPIGALTYGHGPRGLLIAALIAGILASVVGFFLLRRLWPYRET